MRVLIKGAGDLATGVAQNLLRAGLEVLMTENEKPLAIRRGVALAQAVYDGQISVEDLTGVLVHNLAEARQVIATRQIPVLVDPTLASKDEFAPDILVEATLSKKNSGITITDAPCVIALGPGYLAGQDAHVVVETMRGHDLGRLIYEGPAIPNTGSPGRVSGYTMERVLKANANGVFRPLHEIGDLVRMGEPIAYCGAAEPIRAKLDGCLRGILMPGLQVCEGLKVGDIDPRPLPEHCFTVSDKARALGGAVLTAICQFQAAGCKH